MSYRSLALVIAAAIWIVGAPLAAQEPSGPASEIHKQLGPADIIMPHITDSKHLELPCWKGASEWACDVTLPTWNVSIGGRVIDFGPTTHVVFVVL
jgi:hypothetical protein